MKNSLIIEEKELNNIYTNIKELIINSRNNIYRTVNTEMVSLYWNIGKIIIQIQDGKERASYGDTIIEKLSLKLIEEFGKGFSLENLCRMRKFNFYFPILATVSQELSWSHYVELIKIDEEAK